MVRIDNAIDTVKQWRKNIRGEWNIYDEDTGEIIAAFTWISLAYSGYSTVTDYPVEEGAFTSVNKINAPDEISFTVSKSGRHDELSETIDKLQLYKKSVKRVSIITPYRVYTGHNITAADYSHTNSNGTGILTVSLKSREIREETPQYTFTETRTPEISDTVNRGRQQVKGVPEQSLLSKIINKVRELI